MYLNRFTSTYTNGEGPRLINGGVAGAYSGYPDPVDIARGCGYETQTSIWRDENTGGPSLLAYVVVIALGVALGVVLSRLGKGSK